MESRRSFLKSIGPAAAVAMLPFPADAVQEDPCAFFARCLAEAMETRHGGNWAVTNDKKHEFILILKKR